MAVKQESGVRRHIHRAALLLNGPRMTDGQLLECFLTCREEAAFELLVRRHGLMVLGVCRRVLKNSHDAEDAFQATFLVLIRKAASLLPRETLGNWLYGVAYHTALKARAAIWKRRVKEEKAKAMSRPEARTEGAEQDWQLLLDQALSRLPNKYREPVVLCDLEGKTRKEVARQLGIPEGTLSSRLATAHRKLAKPLARHGLTLSGGALAALLGSNAASASVPVPLIASVVEASTLIAAGEAATTAAISANVAALVERMLNAMAMAKLRLIAAVLLLPLGGIALGLGGLAYATADAEPASLQTLAPQPRPIGHEPAAKAGDEPKAADAAWAQWVVQRVQEWQPTKEERIFDEVGWAHGLVEAQRLAQTHQRPVFLFTHHGHIATGRC